MSVPIYIMEQFSPHHNVYPLIYKYNNVVCVYDQLNIFLKLLSTYTDIPVLVSISQHISILFSPAVCVHGLSYKVVRVVIFEYKCMHGVFEYKCM